MIRPRDSQRRRVYKSERIFRYSSRLETAQEVEDFVNKIIRSRWFRNRWSEVSRIKVIHSNSNVRGKSSWIGLGYGEIKIPDWCRWKYYIIHELTHIVTRVEYTPRAVAMHGREFCKNYLALVGRWMGKAHAKKLRQSFREHRVKWVVRK